MKSRSYWPVPAVLAAAAMLASSGCTGMQSALDPAGRDAERIAGLFGWMALGAFLIWGAIIALGLFSAAGRPRPHSKRAARLLILVGGVAFPTAVFAVLLLYGLSMMPQILALPPEPGRVTVAVSGEQWWWRVRYARPGGAWVETANEIRLPVNERTTFVLDSPDVIHSFWIPPLGGKMDMIPGRTTRLALEPTRTGRFRGQCAEFCGASHAFMAFDVEVMEPQAFDAWLDAQQQPAAPPASPEAAAGQEAFLANGCGACHTVRGTHANGRMGPDLTHVGSRLTLGAATIPNDAESLIQWIRHTPELKPGVHMPGFDMLPGEQVRAMAAYLKGLQ